MRTGLALVAVTLLACGGDETTRPVTTDAGSREPDASVPADAGKPDAVEQGGSGGTEPNEIGGQGGSDESQAGSGGEMPTGGMAAGGSGGKPETPPEGGAGAPAEPQERVLWSQTWTVAVHEPVAYGAVEGTKMALILDAGQLCRFGFMAADSGSMQEYETDGKCITAASAPHGAATFYAPDGSTAGFAGRAELVGWKEAVQGKTVLRLRRTQTYETEVLGAGSEAWSYADFTGKWEAIGY